MGYAIGVVGLGVMGANLARNIARRGFSVIGYDRDPDRARALRDAPGEDATIGAADGPDALLAALDRPRRVLVMVPAGAPVDRVLDQLRPALEPGDVLIDGGNSHFRDTDRRGDALAAAGLHLLGTGVSGGEAGALHGPAIMPGGPVEAWLAVQPILEAIAARADDGIPCVAHVGTRGAGHYVKMVHNGIEYGDMQLIAETYDLLRRGAGLEPAGLADIFDEWNQGVLQSYLVEITARILRRTDDDTGRPLVDLILDEAQQKGTGRWMSQDAFDVGAPVPTVTAAVEARMLSALVAERATASRVLQGPVPGGHEHRTALVSAARDALYASKVTSYAQGLALLRVASEEYDYAIDPGVVARIWRAGCIIRAALLGEIRDAYRRDPSLVNLLLDPAFRDAVAGRQDGWRLAVRTAVALGIPVPGLGASLAYYDGYRSARLPANLTQAQRDFFGAHTYRRTDRAGVFHTEWE